MLSLRIELIERSVLIIHSDAWIFSLIISPEVPLRPLVGPRAPSKIRSFSYSASLYLLLSKTRFQKAFSPNAGALSL